jgi:hypothetical protein
MTGHEALTTGEFQFQFASISIWIFFRDVPSISTWQPSRPLHPCFHGGVDEMTPSLGESWLAMWRVFPNTSETC